MELKTNRLILKKMKSEVLNFVYNLASNQQVYYYEADKEPNKDDVFKNFQGKIDRMEKTPNEYQIYIVYLYPKEIPIGVVFIQLNWEETREWEIGYELHPDFWGKGYATEAVKLLLNHCFDTLNAHKIVGFCNANNKKSSKLMERIGMTRDGLLREGRLWHNEWCDEYVYSILEKERSLLND